MTPLALNILARIDDLEHVSFAELAREWPQHFNGGDRQIEVSSPSASKVVLWHGVTAEGAAALDELISGPCVYRPTVPLVYIIDGAYPNLPVAKRIRHYKKDHWLPVVVARKPASETAQPV